MFAENWDRRRRAQKEWEKLTNLGLLLSNQISLGVPDPGVEKIFHCLLTESRSWFFSRWSLEKKQQILNFFYREKGAWFSPASSFTVGTFSEHDAVVLSVGPGRGQEGQQHPTLLSSTRSRRHCPEWEPDMPSHFCIWNVPRRGKGNCLTKEHQLQQNISLKSFHNRCW